MRARRCPRCGAGFTTDGPAAGRRLCDPCRAERASFFDCPACGAAREVRSATRDEQRRPVQCWACRQAEADAARTAAVLAHVARVQPGLDPAVAQAAVSQAARTPVERKWLAEHLAAHPGALSSQDPAAPRVACRLAAALRAAGATAVEQPRCTRCGRPALLVAAAGDGRVCATCDSGSRAEPCSRCGRTRRVSVRLPDGLAVCKSCRLRDPARWEGCSRCGRVRPVNARTAEGAVCTGCYEPPPGRCDGCGEAGPIASRSTGRALCNRCYVRHARPRRQCGGCGKVKVVNRRAADGSPDLCNACHWAVVAYCTRCGDTAPGRGGSGGAHVCLACIARERLDAVLAGPDGRVPAALAGLREAFFSAEQPRTVFTWLDRSPGARVLRLLATGGLALDHEALDGLAQTPSLRHLRQLLVATGALPERDDRLAALERVVRDTAASMANAEDARLLRGFGNWRVLARLRARRGGPPSPLAVKNAKRVFMLGAEFLRSLHDEGLSLADCGQAGLDRWLAEGSADRRRVRYLLAWAAERGAAPRLALPVDSTRGRPAAADGEGRWADARRLLHDDGLDPADRVVGALVVLYAQPLTRIAALRPEDVVEVDGQVHLDLGRDHVFMPEPLGGFLRDLPWRRQVGPSGHAPGAERWLFPGRQAGRHQHPDYLGQRLRAIGIRPRASRTQALLQLGAQVPARAMADLLNLNLSTAVRWNKAAGADWTTYAADRIHRPHLETRR